VRTRRTRLSPLVLLAPATFFEGYDNFLLALALPLIRADFGLTVAQAGAVASIAFAGSFGVLLLLPLADRFGRRPLLTLTIVGYTVATFATAFSRGVADLAALQFVARVFLGTEFALAAIILVESVAAHERGRKLGTLSAATALGMAAAGGGFLLVKALGASWRALYLVGIVPLVVVAWARRGLPETRPRRVARVRLSGIVRPKDLLGVGGVTFLFAMLTTAVTTFASLLIFDEWGWGLSDLRPHYFSGSRGWRSSCSCSPAEPRASPPTGSSRSPPRCGEGPGRCSGRPTSPGPRSPRPRRGSRRRCSDRSAVAWR
jgi:MFS family permease